MDSIVPYNFNGRTVRVVMIDHEPWFVVKDVCDGLGIANSRDALARVPDKFVNTVGLTDSIHADGSRTPGNPLTQLVSEPGLYRIILRSDKPAAEPFIAWVTEDVLPSIRRTGAYHIRQLLDRQRWLVEQFVTGQLRSKIDAKLRKDYLYELVGVKVAVRPIGTDEAAHEFTIDPALRPKVLVSDEPFTDAGND